jgi:hypothetical protein
MVQRYGLCGAMQWADEGEILQQLASHLLWCFTFKCLCSKRLYMKHSLLTEFIWNCNLYFCSLHQTVIYFFYKIAGTGLSKVSASKEIFSLWNTLTWTEPRNQTLLIDSGECFKFGVNDVLVFLIIIALLTKCIVC